MELSTAIRAENGTILKAGGIYLSYSGDDSLPYALSKIISVEGGDLWLKLYRDNFMERPASFVPEQLTRGFRIIPFSVAGLLAWGPPTFPFLLAEEAVTAEELVQRKEDWFKLDDPTLTRDQVKVE